MHTKYFSAVNQVKSLCGAYTGSVNSLSLKQIIRHILVPGDPNFSGGGNLGGPCLQTVPMWFSGCSSCYICT